MESALRDLDDLAGNAARVVSAAEELAENDHGVRGDSRTRPAGSARSRWSRRPACFGKIRTGSPDNSGTPPYAQLAQQLSVLVEADLPFKATAGLHHAQPTPGTDPDRPIQHGFLNLLAGVEALVEGASVDRRRPRCCADADPAADRRAGARTTARPGAPAVPQLRLLRGARPGARPGRARTARGP